MINNDYSETRKRICRFKGSNNLSDKDIIEYLGEEINAYRSKIQKLEEQINKLNEQQPRQLKAVYKAEIFEYESGRIDIAYECDKEDNKECSKECCTIYNYCTHTLNKKYAKNFIKEKFNRD